MFDVLCKEFELNRFGERGLILSRPKGEFLPRQKENLMFQLNPSSVGGKGNDETPGVRYWPKVRPFIKIPFAMGATLSSQGAVQNPEIKESWLLSHSDSDLKHAHNATIEAYRKDGCQILALAFQASEAAYEGSPTQHIRFAVSKDGKTDRRSTERPRL